VPYALGLMPYPNFPYSKYTPDSEKNKKTGLLGPVLLAIFVFCDVVIFALSCG
jgi:hypothetical protein